MSYQTGSASSPVDLLQKLVTWLVSIGWTQDRSAIEGAGWTASLHKSGNYAHFRAAMNESPWISSSGGTGYALDFYLGTGFNGANGWNSQATGAPVGSTSNPVGVGMRLTVGPFTNYYFFADAAGDNVVVVVEVTAGLYVHLGWGLSLTKAGSWTGGPYFFGSSSGYWIATGSPAGGVPGMTSSADCPFVTLSYYGGAFGFIRADVDSFTGKWLAVALPAMTNPDMGYQGKQADSSVRGVNATMRTNFPVYCYGGTGNATEFQSEQVSALDGRANLLPILLWALRDATSTGYSLLGTVPNVFFAGAVGNGFSAGDEYVIGTTTYKIFPNFAVVKQ